MPGLPWFRSLLFGQPHPKVVIGHHGLLGLSSLTLDLDHHFNTHLYIVGQSGQGKSKFIQHLLYQLVFTDWGCGVFDPHSDLANDLVAQLASYPSHRPWLSARVNQQRLIYLDLARADYLLPCNLLKSSYASPYEIAENIVEAFRRVWPDTLTEAPRFAQILRNAIVVLVLNGLTLVELEPLLTNKDFRRRLLAAMPPEPLVVSFFTHQYDRWGREQALFVSPVLNKVTAFLFKPQIRTMLGAQENRLDFRDIIDRRKVLIVNLGGFHDEETQRLFGSLLVTSLEQAAFSRSNVQDSARRPFFCMIDEFPLFCSRDQTSLARILSECRKFRLHLGIAHQTVTQLPGQRIQGALENAKLKVIFGTGRQTAQAIVGDLFMPDPHAVKHEVADEAAQEKSHPLYSQLAEQFEVETQKIQRLHRQQVLVKLPEHEHVIHARTPVVPPSRITAQRLEDWKRFLVKQCGQPREQLEAEIRVRAQRFGVPTMQADTPKAARVDEDVVWQ